MDLYFLHILEDWSCLSLWYPKCISVQWQLVALACFRTLNEVVVVVVEVVIVVVAVVVTPALFSVVVTVILRDVVIVVVAGVVTVVVSHTRLAKYLANKF